MKIFFKTEDHCDTYFCFDPDETNKIILPENITLSNFMLFLQGSLDQIRPVVILKNAEAAEKINLNALKKTHHTLEENFIFLNYSIRNALETDLFDRPLKSFEDIHASLQKILKK